MADEFARPRRTLGRSLTPAAPVERLTSTLADLLLIDVWSTGAMVDRPGRRAGAAASSPSALRIFLRWALPLVAFVLVSAVTSPGIALLATVGLWAPALVGSHRSGYDLLLRVAVVKVSWAE